MKFDLSKAPRRKWEYEDDGFRQGVELRDNGVLFWGHSLDPDDDGEYDGAYLMKFGDFLTTKDPRFHKPSELMQEVRAVLKSTRVR